MQNAGEDSNHDTPTKKFSNKLNVLTRSFTGGGSRGSTSPEPPVSPHSSNALKHQDIGHVQPILITDLEEDLLNAVNRNPSTSVCALVASTIESLSILWRIMHIEGLHDFHLQRDQDPPEDDNGAIPKSDSASSLDIPNSTTLWQVQQRPDDSLKVSTNSLKRPKNILGKTLLYYNFTSFAMALNELQDSWRKSLPRTDSRLRPDIRMLEQADTEGAATEKNRLEEKQRDARKQRKKKKETWKPKWFNQGKVSHIKNEIWIFQQHVLVKRIRGLPGHLLVWQEAGRMEREDKATVYLFWLDQGQIIKLLEQKVIAVLMLVHVKH
ncbi:oxysterol-binding protein-related protein 1 [Caerostris darwini]|uniref:Oxysterol-binding protein-related protein 1 n=1 Tax=Caerostris darwini TaxID=1538125 RepID=A0AAV4Q3H4_9ARAC|nr:oxysterol-binding protein-related protein 1 [Caerostris darwini]